MAEQISENKLGLLLKELLKERSISIRKFSEMTSIDAASISRIINGKRKAKPEHLQEFARCLDIPVYELFVAAGYELNQKQENTDIYESLESIQSTLQASGVYNDSFSIERIKEKLQNYQQYSQTDEGKENILSNFETKVQKTGSIGPFINQLKGMFDKFRMRKGTTLELVIMGSALIYFITAVDVMPDYLFPLGYLDDAVAVKLSLNLLNGKNDIFNL